MKNSNLPVQKSRTATNIAALAGGAATAVAMIGNADAAIVHITSTILVDTSDPTGLTDWDVDGVGGAEFQLGVQNNGGGSAYLRLNSAGNGRGWLNLGGVLALANLPDTTPVQAAPTGAYGWGNSAVNRTVLTQTAGFYSIQNMPNFSSGVSGKAGFRFDAGDGMRYGWASITVTGNNSSLRVTEWAYETTPGAAIAVGAVPEPSVASLGLLAAGAAGLRRRRSKKQ